MKTQLADDPLWRQPPRSIDAEQALLGAIMLNNERLDQVIDLLEPGHFFDPLHASIYEHCCKLIGSGRVATPITLTPFYENAEPIDATMTAVAYLGHLAGRVRTLNVRDYARTIYDLAVRRQLIVIGEDMVNVAYDSPVDFPPREQIEEAETRLFKLVERDAGDRGSVSARKVLAEEIARIDAARKNPGVNVGVSTGLRDLDKKLGGGMQPTDLIVLAGATSMGKTALAGGIMTSSPVPVAFYSLEMSKVQIVDRMISAATGIPTEKLRRGDIDDAEWGRIDEARRAIEWRLDQRDIIIDDTGGISIAQLSARARRLKRRHDMGLVIVDYLQLMRGSRRDNRHLEVAETTSGLKALAKELNVPVLALSQLSRAVDQRTGNRPQLSDLRESGSIEQDADVVMFVFREEYYVERSKPAEDAPAFKEWKEKMALCASKAEVIIGKSRHGPVGTVDLHFDDTTTRFSNLATRQP